MLKKSTEIRLTDAQNHRQPIPIRALFLSDFHFGYKGVDGAALLDCITHYAPERIYLAGDIIDGWKLKKRWHWRANYTRILDALVDHRNRGASIVYLPGNHDERVRRAGPFRQTRLAFRLGIRIRNTCVHRLLCGKRIVVMHGDQFDNRLISGAVSRLGDKIYDAISEWFDLTRPTPLVMIDGRMQKFSLAKALMKKSAKTALRLMNNLERAVRKHIRLKNAHGLICGHTHVPALRYFSDGRVYGNCGMWMGHANTAIIETLQGGLHLVRWPDMRGTTSSADEACITPSEAIQMARYQETALLIRKIRRLWPAQVKAVRPASQPAPVGDGLPALS